MKNTKAVRIRQKVAMLKQQFIQSESGLFDQALDEHEIEAVMQKMITVDPSVKTEISLI